MVIHARRVGGARYDGRVLPRTPVACLASVLAASLGAACQAFGTSEAPVSLPDAGPEASTTTTEPEDAGIVIVLDGGVEGGVCTGECTTACPSGEVGHVLRPTSAVSMNTGPFPRVPAGSTHVAVLDDEGAGDGDESYLACTDPGGAPEEIRFSLKTGVLPARQRITRLVVRARARRNAEGAPGTGLALGVRSPQEPTTYRGTIVPVGTTYGVHTLEFAAVPFAASAGAPWTVGDVERARMVLAFAPADADNPVRVTQAWVEVCTVPE